MSSDPEVIGWLGMAFAVNWSETGVWTSGMTSSCFRQGDEMSPASQCQPAVSA